MYKRFFLTGLAAALLLAGCGGSDERSLQRLSPDAPAATGLPPAPVADQATPLLGRAPFGLYANYPSNDTLTKLSTAPQSPDGRWRLAFTEQGLWLTRVDAAWLWQVPQAAPPQPTIKQGKEYVAPVSWLPNGNLLLRDDAGAWIEANPTSANVKLLPAALQGKEQLTFSPNGQQVLYYTPGKTGLQLWLAKADGTDPKLQGENVTGFWDATGKLVVQKSTAPTPGTPLPREKLAPDLRIGPERQ